jgi:sulfate adenylyltransferase
VTPSSVCAPNTSPAPIEAKGLVNRFTAITEEDGSTLLEPHGGHLQELVVAPERAAELKALSLEWPSWDLTPRQMCDLELLLDGSFSPLVGFMGRADFESVCERMHLVNGLLWPIPITLDVTDELAGRLHAGSKLALRDPEGEMLAVLHVEDQWPIDRDAKARAVYATLDRTHPGVRHLFERVNNVAVGGRIEGLRLPAHYDFVALRNTPAQLRARFKQLGWSRIVAFQTRNPLHRAHVELTLRAVRQENANLLIHPVVGMTKPGDVDHYTRVRCYQAVLPRYPQGSALLSLLPLAMRMGGPREALLHAIIRKNFGCTHIIVGRDHAGPGNDAAGQPFYDPYAAQALVRQHEKELGIGMVPFAEMLYVESTDAYMPADEVPAGEQTLNVSGSDLRARLAQGREIPAWFTYPEVAVELQRSYPPRFRQGFTVFFTGLSGAGKSTIAAVLMTKLLEAGDRPVTLLDGDIVRKNLSSELGFSVKDRNLNIARIGYVASEITKNGGIALCAPIAPYDKVRQDVRDMIEPLGGFVLVHVATPLEVCEQRDRKGLYAKARAGIVQNFTGISDPYEAPTDAAVVIDTTRTSPEEAAQMILRELERQGYVGPRTRA